MHPKCNPPQGRRPGYAAAALAGVLLMLGAAACEAAPGDIDPTYGTLGRSAAPLGHEITAIVPLRDDRLIVVSAIPSDCCRVGTTIQRLDRNGTPDISFGNGGAAGVEEGAQAYYGAQAYGAALRSNGGLLLRGRFEIGGGFVAALTADGRPDPIFAGEYIRRIDSPVTAVASQLDGSTIYAAAGPGVISETGLGLCNADGWTLHRVTPAGQSDSTFGTNGTAKSREVDGAANLSLFSTGPLGGRRRTDHRVGIDAAPAVSRRFNRRLVRAKPSRAISSRIRCHTRSGRLVPGRQTIALRAVRRRRYGRLSAGSKRQSRSVIRCRRVWKRDTSRPNLVPTGYRRATGWGLRVRSTAVCQSIARRNGGGKTEGQRPDGSRLRPGRRSTGQSLDRNTRWYRRTEYRIAGHGQLQGRVPTAGRRLAESRGDLDQDDLGSRRVQCRPGRAWSHRRSWDCDCRRIPYGGQRRHRGTRLRRVGRSPRLGGWRRQRQDDYD